MAKRRGSNKKASRRDGHDKEVRRDHLEVDGTIQSVFAGGHFTVALDLGPTVRASICGRMRRWRVRVLLGDRVRVALSPHDLTHGLITHRALARAA